MALMMAAMAEMDGSAPRTRVVHPQSLRDLVDEYNKIKRKESGLSASERRSVIYKAERLIAEGKVAL